MAFIDEIAYVVERYCEAVHTQDEAAFKSLWTCEPTNVEISGNRLFRGMDEIYDTFLVELIGGSYESIYLVNEGLDAHQLTDDVAVAVFRYHTECIRRGTGEPHGIRGLETQVLKRVDGQWKIAHIQYHGKDIQQ